MSIDITREGAIPSALRRRLPEIAEDESIRYDELTRKHQDIVLVQAANGVIACDKAISILFKAAPEAEAENTDGWFELDAIKFTPRSSRRLCRRSTRESFPPQTWSRARRAPPEGQSS